MGSETVDDYPPETCQERCFTDDLGKLVPRVNKALNQAFSWFRFLGFRAIKVKYAKSECLLFPKADVQSA